MIKIKIKLLQNVVLYMILERYLNFKICYLYYENNKSIFRVLN